MKNENKYQLNYCVICKNRRKNSEYNVICNLTNETPSFENKCDEYIFDKITYDQHVDDIKTEINEKYDPKNFFGGVIYKEYNEIKKSKYKNQTIGLKIFKHYLNFIGILTASLFVLITLPVMYKPKLENRNNMMIFYLFLFLLSIYSFFVLFFKRKKIFIETKVNSFIIENKKEVFWNSIVSTGVLRISNSKGPASIFVLLGTLNDGIIKIRCENVEIEAEDLIKIIHLNVNVIHQRFGIIDY